MIYAAPSYYPIPFSLFADMLTYCETSLSGNMPPISLTCSSLNTMTFDNSCRFNYVIWSRAAISLKLIPLKSLILVSKKDATA